MALLMKQGKDLLCTTWRDDAHLRLLICHYEALIRLCFLHHFRCVIMRINPRAPRARTVSCFLCFLLRGAAPPSTAGCLTFPACAWKAASHPCRPALSPRISPSSLPQFPAARPTACRL